MLNSLTHSLTHSLDNPSNGNIYLYDRNATKLFKHDGILWSKKKGSERTQETYQQIKINGVDRMVGIYSKAADDQSFRKRIYKLQSEDSHLVFVHYRVCIKQGKYIADSILHSSYLLTYPIRS